MNKKTTLLGLLGLATVAGAGYLYSTGQTTEVTEKISSYLPESVRDYLPESFAAKAENQADQQPENIDQTDVMDQSTLQNISQQEGADEIFENQEHAEDQLDSNKLADLAGEEILNEIEESIAVPEKTAEIETKEIHALEQRLQDVNSKINGLDEEKSELEVKFQNILKQNKALAMKLKEIDDQLKVNMK